jgi:hypothetical protein
MGWYFYLAALKVFRQILPRFDEFHKRNFQKADVWKSLLDLAQKVTMKDNIISSTVLELFDCVRIVSGPVNNML